MHGILILDKPLGVTSNRALQEAKNLFKATTKVGHGGSLDPTATGLLPLYFGEAVKFSRFSLEADKHYQVTASLGLRTESGDLEGELLERRPIPKLTESHVEKVLDQFRGTILQTPPMYSALKHKGKTLYKLARRGIVVERVPREITIHKLSLLALHADSLDLDVQVSKGSYIRSLVESIGEALGCGAHVSALRRLTAGPFVEEQMLSFETLNKILTEQGQEALEACLLPVNSGLDALPILRLDAAFADRAIKGQVLPLPELGVLSAVPISELLAGQWVCLHSLDNQFLGIGQILDNECVRPKRMLSTYSLCPRAGSRARLSSRLVSPSL